MLLVPLDMIKYIILIAGDLSIIVMECVAIKGKD